jgi:hypothetical protein
MRLTANKCARNKCNNYTRAGFRFCFKSDSPKPCGGIKIQEEEE